jgi:hypothetical protein
MGEKKVKLMANNWLLETTSRVSRQELEETFGPLLEGDLLLKLGKRRISKRRPVCSMVGTKKQ